MTYQEKLPAPRLQIRWEPSERSGWEWQYQYELVLPLGEYDIRREQYDDYGELVGKIDELVVRMKEPGYRGSSTTPCSTAYGDRYYDAPYRDGAHVKWDSDLLGNLPIFVIAPDGTAFARPDYEGDAARDGGGS
ncbi:hypothetical protein KPB05_10225 [Burkholderia gladioli]|uniref:hypothetical protein n=1 Tax=Burkholderia gladioli TaxID=28095 RepID=UPI00286031C7|nr:hypothetical protein [Burkholderia gladioli]MDR8087837.1 hypothetical protein [Burkholderia gladioli]